MSKGWANPMPRGWSYVYAIQEGDDGPIKIGTAKDPDERIATLQCGNPAKLYGRGAWTAPPGHEQALHAAFAHLRIRGEWFEPTDALCCFVDFMGGGFWFKQDMPDDMREFVFADE